MGLFNALRTSVSGMNAQSSYLSAIGDNIANSATVGYKDASTQFETILGQQTPGSYESGGVLAQTRYNVTDPGTLTTTSSSTDLAIEGNGFFVVSKDATSPGNYLTRAGSFIPDKDGNLVNTAGYTLQGYAVGANGVASSVLSAVNISSTKLMSSPSSLGTVSGNLPSSDAAGVARTNQATFYDSTGAAINGTITYTSQGSGSWSVSATGTDASGNTITATPTTVNFDANGNYASGGPLVFPNTTTGTSLDFSKMTQLANGFGANYNINGNAPSAISSVTVGTDGTLTGVYANGSKSVLYDIPIATVTSPDNLTSVTGNLYQQSNSSGSLIIGTAGVGAAGDIKSSNLESSTVDLATELTNMIQAQRAYEANSKVLQAASDLLSKLNNIQTG